MSRTVFIPRAEVETGKKKVNRLHCLACGKEIPSDAGDAVFAATA